MGLITSFRDLVDTSNTVALVNKALGKNYPVKDKRFVIPTQDVSRASKIIENFIQANQNKLVKEDIPGLKKLKTLAKFLAIHSGTRKKENGRFTKTSLEETINKTIRVVKGSWWLPPEILSIIAGYSSVDDAANFAVMKHSPQLLQASVVNGETRDLGILYRQIRKEFNWTTAKKILSTFFKHASANQQRSFFATFHNEDYTFFTRIISAISRDQRNLNLSGCKFVRDDHMECISQHFDSLRTLNLSFCKLSDEAIMTITGSPNMRSLENFFLSGESITDKVIIAVANSLHNLQNLGLTWCNISDIALLAIFKSPFMANLQDLNLCFCTQISNQALIALAESPYVKDLKNLHLSGSPLISDEGVSELVSSVNSTNLESLDLSHCKISDEGVLAIANSANMANLQHLNLGECNLVTNDGVICLANSSNMANLRSLYLYGCHRVTDKAILAIAESSYMSNLKSLHLPPRISKEVIEKLKDSDHTKSCSIADLSK